MATRQLCDALDEGRGIGLYYIILYKHISQLSVEDQAGYLYHSVMGDAKTKILTGGLEPEDLKVFGEYLLMDHFDPWRIKYIQKNPIFAPVESVRQVVTDSLSQADAVADTKNFSEADSVTHSDQFSISRGTSVGDSIAFTEGEQDTYTFGENASSTNSHNWGTADTVSGSHSTGKAASHGRGRGSSISNGTTDSKSSNEAARWSTTDGRNSSTTTGEGQSMLPPEEHVLYTEDPDVVGLQTNTSTTDGRSSTSGRNGMRGASSSRAKSRVRSNHESEMDTTSASSSDSEGWSHGVQNGYSVADQRGTNEAWAHGTNRSTTRGQTVTNSTQVTNGFSDTVGHTSTRGGAFTKGQTITRGKSVALTPFYEYDREDVETPVFLSPEEQLLLVMQRIHQIPARHFLLKAPGSQDCIIRAPHVADPMITQRRLSAGLETVYDALPCYTSIAEQGRADSRHSDHGGDDIVDVEEVHEMQTSQSLRALPSPAPPENLTEDERWQRWHEMGHGRTHRRQEK